MSTHNIGFNEDLTKIIFELSSNIIKYTPYFFFWGGLFYLKVLNHDIDSVLRMGRTFLTIGIYLSTYIERIE